MQRTALRLATMAALLNGGSAPYPTVAGVHCYDSRIDDILDVVADRRMPTIVVRTDDDYVQYSNAQFTGRQLRLLIELGVITGRTVKVGETEQVVADWPRTDSQLEAMLDVLEWQVYNCLFGYSRWTDWFKGENLMVPVRYTSTPRYSTPERGSVRLAVRTLELLVNTRIECVVRPVKEYSLPQPPESVLPPVLVSVLQYLTANTAGDFKAAVDRIIAVINRYGPMQRPTAPPLQVVGATVPDLEIEALWQIEQEAPFTAEPAAVQVGAETPNAS